MIRFLSSIALAFLFGFRVAAAEPNQLDASENLFTILAALNSAGYDTDLNSPSNHPLRMQVRQYIAEQKPAVLAEIRDFYKEHPGIGPYLSLGLSIGAPPEFSFKTRTVDIPPDAYALAKFIPLLARFYNEAKISVLWNRLQPAHNAAIEAYHEPVSRIALAVNSYFRSSTAGYIGRRFTVYVDLLGAPDQVHTRSYGDDYFVIVTNTKEPRINEIRHAFLHYQVEPLVAKYGLVLMKKSSLSDLAATAPALDESYKNDFVLLTSECLIKAIESRLDHKPEMVNQAAREGFILAPFFAEQLIGYEKEPVAMRLFFPDMLKALDARRETQRLSNVTFTSKQQTSDRPKQVIESEKKSASLGTIERAESLYKAQQYEEAKNLLLKALEQPGDTAEHARAYYNLGLIALRAKNPDMAEKLFQKVVESSPDPFSQTWALVYLGRLAGLSGDRNRAVKYYHLALEVKDGSEEAHRAAEKGIENTK